MLRRGGGGVKVCWPHHRRPQKVPTCAAGPIICLRGPFWGTGREGIAPLQQACGVSWPGLGTEWGGWGHGVLWGSPPQLGGSAGRREQALSRPGVSPSLAARPQCLLQREASNTYSQGSDGSLPSKALGALDPMRFLLRTEGGRCPRKMNSHAPAPFTGSLKWGRQGG